MMGMTGGRTPPRGQLSRRVTEMSSNGPYYAADAGGRRRGPFGAVPSIPGLPWPATVPGASIPGIDQFLQGAGQLFSNFGLPPLGGGGIPGMPNFQLPAGVGDLIGMLPVSGLFTPWAGETAPSLWQEVGTPTANIAVIDLTAVEALLRGAAMGQPGFLAILAETPTPAGNVNAAFQGTAYKYAQTQAVFSQQDAKNPPKILFVHWGALRDPADPLKGDTSLATKALSLNGKPVFAMPVDRSGSTLRGSPSPGQFAQAYQAQFGMSPSVEPASPYPQVDPSLPPGVPQPTAPVPDGPTPGSVQPGQPSNPGTTVPARSQMSSALMWGGAALVAGLGIGVVVNAMRKS